MCACMHASMGPAAAAAAVAAHLSPSRASQLHCPPLLLPRVIDVMRLSQDEMEMGIYHFCCTAKCEKHRKVNT